MARTDRAGYGEEFGPLAAELAPPRTADTEGGAAVVGRSVPDPTLPAGAEPAEAVREPGADGAASHRSRHDDGEDDDDR